MTTQYKGNLVITPCSIYVGNMEYKQSGVVFNSFQMTNMARERNHLQLRTLLRQQQQWERGDTSSNERANSDVEEW